MARILVIDDNTSVRSVLEFLLADAGHNLTSARTGEEGIRLFDEVSPDMVVVDVHMPVMSGFDVCRAVKAKRSNVPVIMLTGCPTKDVLRIAKEAGAAEVLRKPFELPELYAAIARALPPPTEAPVIQIPSVNPSTEAEAV